MAALAFALFWIIVGFAVFFLALRGGPRGARAAMHSQTRSGTRANLIIWGVICAFGIALPLVILNENHDTAEAGTANIELTEAEARGREAFTVQCAQCHVLAAANAIGQQGPSLDALKPPKELILDAVENGRIRGNGTMPAALLNEEEADEVAAFIVKVAGKE